MSTNKLVKLLSIGVISALSFIPTSYEARATGSIASTCAALDASKGGMPYSVRGASTQVTADVGDVVTVTSGDGSSVELTSLISSGSPSGSSATVTMAGTFETHRANFSTTVTVSCVVAASTSSTEDTLKSLSGLASISMNQQGAQIGQSVGDAVGGGLNGGGASPFISQNGFSVSSRGLASLNNVGKPAQSASAAAREQIYGAAHSINEVPDDTPWNIWLSGQYDHFDGDGSSFDGGVGTVIAGVDYRLSDTLLFGGLIGYGTSNFDVGTTNDIESSGYTLGAYFGAQLENSIMADGFVAYTRSDYDLTAGTTTGSFDADRYSLGLNVYGSMPMDGFKIEPGISFIYGSEKQDSYTDSTATAIAGQTIRSGRVSVGPKFVFDPIENGGGSFTPWVGARYEFNFSDANVVAATGTPDVGDNSSARVSAGFSTEFGAGTFSLSGDVGGLGSGDYVSYGGSAKIRIPLE